MTKLETAFQARLDALQARAPAGVDLGAIVDSLCERARTAGTPRFLETYYPREKEGEA